MVFSFLYSNNSGQYGEWFFRVSDSDLFLVCEQILNKEIPYDAYTIEPKGNIVLKFQKNVDLIMGKFFLNDDDLYEIDFSILSNELVINDIKLLEDYHPIEDQEMSAKYNINWSLIFPNLQNIPKYFKHEPDFYLNDEEESREYEQEEPDYKCVYRNKKRSNNEISESNSNYDCYEYYTDEE
jgi:hypothetical protein